MHFTISDPLGTHKKSCKRLRSDVLTAGWHFSAYPSGGAGWNIRVCIGS